MTFAEPRAEGSATDSKRHQSRTDRQLLGRIERLLVVATLLLSTRAFIDVGQTGPDYLRVGVGSMTSPRNLAVFGMTAIFVVGSTGRAVRALVDDVLLVALVALASVSFLWAIDPATTLRSSATLAGASMFGAVLGVRYDLGAQLRLVMAVTATAAAASLVLAVTAPGKAVIDGALQGVYSHKNALGQVAAFGAVSFAVRIVGTGRRSFVGYAGFAVCTAALLLTRSVTSIAGAALVGGLIAGHRYLRDEDGRLILFPLGAALVAVGCATLVVGLATDAVLGAVGKDATLNQRLPLWVDLVRTLEGRPWLGFGLDGFFRGALPPPGDIWQIYGWRPRHAHNGFLAVALELGLVGFGLTVAHVVRTYRRAFRHGRRSRDAGGLWPLAYLTVLVVLSMAYSLLLSSTLVFWTLYVAAAVALARERTGSPQATTRSGPSRVTRP